MKRTTIEHKIEPNTPDEVCEVCVQNYQGICRAMSVAHTEEERKTRTTGFGMECDKSDLKKVRTKRYGIKYRTE